MSGFACPFYKAVRGSSVERENRIHTAHNYGCRKKRVLEQNRKRRSVTNVRFEDDEGLCPIINFSKELQLDNSRD